MITLIQGNALALPLPDKSVDLIVTSPPYFALRSYQDAGEHYAGQLGSEATPAEFMAALLAATREMVRVLKPSGSIFVNLGDKYAGTQPGAYRRDTQPFATQLGDRSHRLTAAVQREAPDVGWGGVRQKSLIGIPWRYALACIDDLGLILRAEIIWSKPNGLPESVTDRVRRSHEQWFHFTVQPRYYAAVDEIREPHVRPDINGKVQRGHTRRTGHGNDFGLTTDFLRDYNPLGKLPGSVWTIPTQPLTVPPELGVDHFAAFPMAWPRRIIQGWSPPGICTGCGEGRRPVVVKNYVPPRTGGGNSGPLHRKAGLDGSAWDAGIIKLDADVTITGYACACPDTTAHTTPAVVLDPFGGTGTTALVAHALGRHGISVDMSADYNRLAAWRTTDEKQIAKAAGVKLKPKKKPKPEPLDIPQDTLFGEEGAA